MSEFQKLLRRIILDEMDARGLSQKIETSETSEVLIPSSYTENTSIAEYRNYEKELKPLMNDEYKILIKEQDFENEPLPNEYYKNPKAGKFWVQVHIRGITPEEYEKVKKDEMPLWKSFIGHSLHVDWRSKFAKEVMQFVLTEDSIESYFNVMEGRRDPETGNVAKGLAIIKPSAEPKREKEMNAGEALLSSADAERIGSYILKEKSYWIQPGDVGSLAYTYAYMGAVLTGTVKTGVLRPDFKEVFCRPDVNLPEKNKELFNGRWIWKAFKSPRALWWSWKASANPLPSNPHCECDQGNYDLVPAERLTKFKKEDYPEWDARKDKCPK